MKLHKRIMSAKRKRRYRKGGKVPGLKGIARADRKPRGRLHAQAGAGVQAVPGVTYDIPMKLDRNMMPLQQDLVPSAPGSYMGHLDLRGVGQGDPRDVKPPANTPPFPTETLPRTEGQGWSRGQPAPHVPQLRNAPPLEESQGPPPPLPPEFQPLPEDMPPPPPPPPPADAGPPADVGPGPSKHGGRMKSGGRAGRLPRGHTSPFSIAGREPRNKEHVGPFGKFSPMHGYDQRTPEERRAGSSARRSILGDQS
jgi:hypothetical protein